MELKPGYKQTEVGGIPDQWVVKPLGELFEFSGGYSASRSQLSTEGHCYLHYGDIHGSAETFIDTHVNYQDIPKLDIPLKRVSPRSLLADGDVVFVDASEDDEGASRHVVVVNKENVPFISGLHTIVGKSKSDELLHEYRRYCFQTAAIRQQFLFYAVGTKVVGISKTNIPKLFLPVPPLAEQRAIAEALSDVDELLGGLNRLVVKRRDLKQAAMQLLLTGQMRLPGFHGEWKVKRLGDLAEIVSGGTPKTTEPAYWNGGIKWCTPTDITGCMSKYVRETERTISRLGLQSSGASLLPAGALLLCSRATIGEVRIAGGAISTNQGFKSLVCKPSVSNEFLYYKLLTMKQKMVERAFGSTFLEISKGNVAALEVDTPPLPEQTAIAVVLSDMDAALVALETRRDKTRELKQAMMQELLTGRNRLL
jgi:type I restriction enzyme S subunit